MMYLNLKNNDITMQLIFNQFNPFEIKMRESVSVKDAGALFKFFRYFGRKQGLLIAVHDETEFANNGMVVKVLPYWKYWSIMKWVEEAKEGM